MLKILKIVVGTVVAVCIILFLALAHPLWDTTIKSPDGKFLLQHIPKLGIFESSDQSCEGFGQLELKNSAGKILYSSGYQYGLVCLPPYAFFPNKALILSVPDYIFVTSSGEKVTNISQNEFDQVLKISDVNVRHSILRFLGGTQFGLKNDYLTSVMLRLLSTKKEADVEDAAALASKLDMKTDDEKLHEAVMQLALSHDLFIRREFFDKLYDGLSPKDYLAHLEDFYFSKNDPQFILYGMDVLEMSKKVSDIQKKQLLMKYFRNPDLTIQTKAMRALVRLGFGADILNDVFRSYYSVKDLTYTYNKAGNPGEYLNAAFDITKSSAELSKAILFGLEHPAEAYWRDAFYLIRDHAELNDEAFVSSLFALKVKHPDDSLLTGQIDETVSRIKAH